MNLRVKFSWAFPKEEEKECKIKHNTFIAKKKIFSSFWTKFEHIHKQDRVEISVISCCADWGHLLFVNGLNLRESPIISAWFYCTFLQGARESTWNPLDMNGLLVEKTLHSMLSITSVYTILSNAIKYFSIHL